MKMENMGDAGKVRAMYEANTADTLVLQQVGLRASIHAVEFLIANKDKGATPELILESLKGQLFTLHEVAHARGIQLMAYR